MNVRFLLSNLVYPSIIRKTILTATRTYSIRNDAAPFNVPEFWVELFHSYDVKINIQLNIKQINVYNLRKYVKNCCFKLLYYYR